MSGDSTIGTQLDVVRAAIASRIAASLDAPLVTGPGEADRSYTLLAGGFAGLGHHLVEELLPLEQLMREAAGEDTSDRASITDSDLLLDSLMARLHDTVLNPAPPFRFEPPLLVDINPIDRIYGEAVEAAHVAGRVAMSDDAQAADALLFRDGEPTALLEQYREYERLVDEAAAAVDELDADAPADQRRRLVGRLERLEAEWIGLGHRREVEAAFDLIRAGQTDAGFEDERAAVLERFESGRRFRRDAAGLSYHRSHLVPTAPLLDDRSTTWTSVSLDRDQIRDAVTPDVVSAFGFETGAIDASIADFAHIGFEHLVCEIRRDWLDPSFLAARYWRLDGEPLSDGVGGGTMPCLPRRAVFLRNVNYSIHDVGVELVSPRPRTGAVVMPKLVPKRIAVPAQLAGPVVNPTLIDVARRAGLDRAARVMSAERVARSRPTIQPLRGADVAATAVASRPTPSRRTRPPAARSRDLAATIAGRVLRPRTVVGAERGGHDVRVTGSITTAPEDHELVDLVTVSAVALRPEIGGPVAIEITRPKAHRGDFTTRLRRRMTVAGTSESIEVYAIRLHRADGDVIAEHLVDMAATTERVRLRWKALPQPSEFTVAEDSPLLHAYDVRLLPLCPNPDESLVWT